MGCTENLQLTVAKVSTPEFREHESKLSRYFKGLISTGNVGVRSLDGTTFPKERKKGPQTAGFCDIAAGLQFHISVF